MRASTTAYLQLMRHTVEHTITGELKSEEARRGAHILLGSIDELIRRERVMPDALAVAIPAGIAIARQLFDQLVRVGVRPDSGLLDRLKGLEIDGGARYQGPRADYLALEAILESLLRLCLGRPLKNEPELAGAARQVAAWRQSVLARQLAPLPQSPVPAPAAAPLTEDRLRSFLRSVIADDPGLEIADFVALSGGMSKQTWRFRLLRSNGVTEELVARKDPSQPYIDFGCFPIRREFEFVRRLFECGFPVPEPLWLSLGGDGGAGDFYVMRRVEGGNTGGLFSEAAIPESTMLSMAEALARLHRLPLSEFRDFIETHRDARLLAETAGEATRRYLLDLIAAREKAVRTPDSAETYLLMWALNNIPRNDAPPSALHGDFTPHNCLWREDQLTAVIDWECADFGDPVADLAYLMPHIAARMDWERFLAHYERHLGRSVNRESFAFYSVLLHIRTSVALNVISTRIENAQAPNIIALNVDYEYVPTLLSLCIAGAEPG